MFELLNYAFGNPLLRLLILPLFAHLLALSKSIEEKSEKTAAADQAIATTTTKQLTSRVRTKAEMRLVLLPVLELDCGSVRAGFARLARVSRPLIVIVARS